jgi:pimeloyl-ACP methyl ester carboxylesterase
MHRLPSGLASACRQVYIGKLLTSQLTMTRAKAIAHDGTEIEYRVLGEGTSYVFLGYGGPSALDPAGQKPWIEGLGQNFRLIVIDYPGEPKMYTLTPAAVARDYLAIADAAGADRFAYYGFSWGAVSGLQLALRTNRLTGFIAGGFPMIDGPYAEMLRLATAVEQGPIELYGEQLPHMPEYGRQYRTYYEGLRSFSDRAIQGQVRCPRLNFVGTADDVTLNGEILTRLGHTIAEHRAELEQFGWEVRLLEGMGHIGENGAARPEVAVPLVCDWLKRRVPGSVLV